MSWPHWLLGGQLLHALLGRGMVLMAASAVVVFTAQS